MKVIYDKSKQEIGVGDIIITSADRAYLIFKTPERFYKALCLTNGEEATYMGKRLSVTNINELSQYIDIAKIIKHKDIVISEEVDDDDDWI